MRLFEIHVDFEVVALENTQSMWMVIAVFPAISLGGISTVLPTTRPMVEELERTTIRGVDMDN